MSKHDRYVERLAQKLQHHYDSILINVTIYRKKRRKWKTVGEIDILARIGDSYDIYEVKCSYRITKARMQLKKIRKNSTYNIRHGFFYCGSSAMLVKV